MNRSLHIRVAVACLAAAFLLVALPTPARAGDVSIQATPSFTFTGSGWGHGIGMSQYGAQGYALTGWAYDRIIKHYYQGTSIAGAKSLSVRVYIDKDAAPRASWTVRAVGAPLTVYSDSQSISLAANTYYTFKNSSSGVTVSSYPAGSVLATFGGNTTADPEGAALLEVRDTSGPAIHESYPNGYPGVRWRGVVQFVRSSTTALHAVNVLNIEQYLYGVVPRESPSSWHAQALRAQAVAARSYAKRKVDPNDDGVLDAHLRCTTADQVYAGHSRYVEDSGLVVSHEAASTNAAVDATKDQVVKYGSTIVMTYFSSSMGGHTANIEDSWGYSTPQPYYTGVPSPYEALAGCPNQYWAVSLTGLKTAELLSASSTVRSELSTHGLTPVPVGAGTSVWVSGIRVEYGVSGYPRWVYFTFSSGDIVKLTSYTVRGALGLKSPHFTPSGFPIMRIEGPNRYATAAAVSQAAFSSTAPAVVLASGEDYADALSGSAL
ncbi:MAG: cell wall-binding repeat-containing protein, partial [Coriobacteriia bacterium]|nr:cell wall-binding repeat-containing protein [Coriobacteriia bacterium]